MAFGCRKSTATGRKSAAGTPQQPQTPPPRSLGAGTGYCRCMQSCTAESRACLWAPLPAPGGYVPPCTPHSLCRSAPKPPLAAVAATSTRWVRCQLSELQMMPVPLRSFLCLSRRRCWPLAAATSARFDASLSTGCCGCRCCCCFFCFVGVIVLHFTSLYFTLLRLFAGTGTMEKGQVVLHHHGPAAQQEAHGEAEQCTAACVCVGYVCVST